MRITLNEKNAIKDVVLALDKNATIYLYGSRTNDNLKGGDIDILVISEALEFKDKINILTEIKQKIGDQKIDLSIKTHDELKTDIFFKSALLTAIKL